MVAPTRAQLGLPEQPHLPPDLSVPLLVPTAMVDEWHHEDAAGSAAAAYALAVHASQSGNIDEARSLFTRAAGRGHAEATYALAVMTPHDDADDAVRDLVAADEAGSSSAAALLASLYRDRGDDTAAEAARQRALERARSTDEQGSADAALVVASLEADPDRRLDACRRADARGSADAAWYVALVADQAGQTDEAIAAYLRACNRGRPRAGIPLGQLLVRQRRGYAARRVWTQTRTAAVATGDAELFTVAQQLLVPPLRTWLKSHLVAVVAYSIVSVALLVTGNWRWDVVLVAAALVFLAFRYRPVKGALFIPPDDEDPGTQSFSAQGVSLMAGFTDQLSHGGTSSHLVVATGWDLAKTQVAAAAAAGLVALLAGWAAGWLDLRTLGTWAMFVAGIVVTTQALTALPEALGKVPPSPDDPRTQQGAIVILARIGGPFMKLQLRVGAEDPRIQGLTSSLRSARPPTPLLAQQIGALLAAAAALIGAALLVLPAVSPDLALSLGEVAEVAEVVLIVWLLARCLTRAGYAVSRRPPEWRVAAVFYAVVAIFVAAVAVLLGVWSPAGLVPWL